MVEGSSRKAAQCKIFKGVATATELGVVVSEEGKVGVVDSTGDCAGSKANLKLRRSLAHQNQAPI